MKPLFVVVSPMCRAFSAWQALNKAKHPNSVAHMEETKQEAMMHLNFATEICREQLANGRYFLFEHPFGATSWHEECLRSLAEDSRVGKAHSDQCQMGAVAASGPSKGGPVKKPIGFLSNSRCILKELSRRCSGQGGACSRPQGGKHVPCEGKVARDAAIYPAKLCKLYDQRHASANAG